MRFTPSNIVPSEFAYHDSYDLGGSGMENPPFNVWPCEKFIDAAPVENFKFMDKCCVCGTVFRYGEAWEHKPSGQRLSIGHVCAAKYGLMANDTAYQGKRAIVIAKAKHKAKLYEIGQGVITFILQNPEVRTWLSFDHYIVGDIKAALFRWGSITKKQMALLKKIYGEEQDRKMLEASMGPRIQVPVTDERILIEATLLGTKEVDGFGYYDSTITKMIVRVETPAGQYKLYGTMPQALWLIDTEDGNQIALPKGSKISFMAKVEPSHDDAFFGFFKRPTKVKVVELNYTPKAVTV